MTINLKVCDDYWRRKKKESRFDQKKLLFLYHYIVFLYIYIFYNTCI